MKHRNFSFVSSCPGPVLTCSQRLNPAPLKAKGLKHGLSGMMTFAFIFSPSQRWAKTLAFGTFHTPRLRALSEAFENLIIAGWTGVGTSTVS